MTGTELAILWVFGLFVIQGIAITINVGKIHTLEEEMKKFIEKTVK